jgi:beta-galactosidase
MHVSMHCLLVSVWFWLLAVPAASQGVQPQYRPLTPEQVKTSLRSTSRLVYSLSGDWQRAINGGNGEWTTVTLPYSETARGEFRYRRTFTITQQLINSHDWYIQFLGSNYKTQVFVNGQYLQNHAGGTVPFQVFIPDQYLRSGENTIELVVSNELDAITTIPLRPTPHQAAVFGGIFRELYLVGTSEVYFNSVETKTIFRDARSGVIQVTATLSSGALRNFLLQEGDTASARIKNTTQLKTSIAVVAELRTPDSTVIQKATPVSIELMANRSAQVKLEVPFSDVSLWSPQSPFLYTFVAQIKRGDRVVDDYTTPFGLYNVKSSVVDSKPTLFLNGEPMVFKCVDYIEDSEQNRQTPNMAEYEKDIIAIKTLGANIVRLRYSAPHPYFLYLCDKYGLFVLVELPFEGAPRTVFGRENFIVTLQLAIREMILAYENNPSVLAWRISGDAVEGTSEFAAYSQRIREVIRPYSSKLVYKSVRVGTKTLETEGYDFIVFDVNGDGNREANAVTFRAEAERLVRLANQTVSVFSFGKIINPDNHNGYSDPLSIEAQAKFIRTYFRVLQENKICDNVIISSYNDYLAERPMLNINNPDQFVITSGLVSRSRDARVAATMVKALFNDEREPVLETGNYIPESPTFYTVVSIGLLILFFVMINSNRRFREDVMRALMRPYNFYTDIRDQRILSNAGTLTLAVILSLTIGLLVSSVLYFLRFNFLLDYVLTHFIESNSLKEFVNTIIWMPWASTLVAGFLFLMLLAGVTLIVRAGSMFVRSRILLSDALVITVWACIPLFFLLLMTMGLYKVLTTTLYTNTAFGLIVLILIWCLYRILRGTSVIYDVRASRIYIIGVAFVLLVLGGIALYYDAHYATFAYAEYFFTALWN